MSTSTTPGEAGQILARLPPLPPATAEALTDLVAAVLAAPSVLPRHFAAAARRVGRGPLPGGATAPSTPDALPVGVAPVPATASAPAAPSTGRQPLPPSPSTGQHPVPPPTGQHPLPPLAAVEDVARVALLVAARRVLDDAALRDVVGTLYHQGDGDERRAVLLALPALGLDDTALPLVRDALRTNDVRLVAAALGPYAAAHLDDAAWRHGVLKCLFTGIPLTAVHDLDRRTDDELVRMVAAFAEERTAAGRDVPPDARRLLGRSART